MSKRTLGVCIARFQAPSLTPAHEYLLSQIATRVSRVLVMLGTTPVPCLKKNPLEYTLRARMLEEWWEKQYQGSPELMVVPLPDCPSDEEWVRRADELISAINVGGDAVVFCGPDGAGPTYQMAGGRWPVEMLDSAGGHASRVRENLVPQHTADFRSGVIYGIERDYVRPRLCIDAIIRDGDQILLGHKHIDRRDDGRQWRLIGGFVDVTDQSLEAAVRREVLEETGLEIAHPMYVGSAPVEDWRYRNGPESIISAVFSCQRIFGKETPNDDIDDLRWFHKDKVEAVIHPIHEALLKMGLRVAQ